jgi:hypothetical protein
MTHEDAIKLMKTSTNMAEWNNNREVVKEAFGVETGIAGELLTDGNDFKKSPIPYIDSNINNLMNAKDL